MQNNKQKFSFSEAAAQQPQRQRFSFAEPKTERVLPQSMASIFPARNALSNIAVTNVLNPKPKLGEVVNEALFPTYGFDREEISQGWIKGSLKDKGIGFAKGAGRFGVDIYKLGTGALRLALGTQGLETPTEDKIVSGLREKLKPDTAAEVSGGQIFDVFGLGGTLGKAGKVKKLDELLKLGKEAKNKEAARLVLKNAGATDEIINTLKLDVKVVAAKTTDDVKKVLSTVVEQTTKKGGFSFAPVVTKTADVPPVSAVTNIPPSAVPNVATKTLAEAAEVAPILPQQPTTDEAINSLQQWISGGNRRAMSEPVIKQIESLSIKPKAPVTLYRQGDVNPDEFQSWSTSKPTRGEEFTEQTFSPDEILIDTTDPKIYSVVTPEQKKIFDNFKRVGNEVIVLPKTMRGGAIRETSEQVNEVVTKRLDEAVENGFESNPTQTQKIVTQDVAKTYSNTDASKGFVTDAVNHMDNVPPIKNATAKARNFAKTENVPIDLPPETRMGWLRTRIQDSAYRLGLVQKKITESGQSISDEANAYMQREAYIGRAAARIGKVEEDLGMVAGNESGLFMRMRKDGITIEQLDEYMRAKAAGARNKRVSQKTGGKIADGGSGLTNKEAAAILNRYKNNVSIQEYAKEYRQMVINQRLQLLKESGLYTDEQIKLITQGEPDYVPFKVAEFSRPQGGGKGFSVASRGVQGLKGSARTDRTNAVIQGVVDLQETIIRTEKNKSLQSLAKLIKENPDDTLWEIKPVSYTPQYDRYGEVQFLRKNPVNERTSVEFFENGKAYEIRFHDEALAKVFTEQGLTKPIPGLVKINNYLRAVNTVINPEFMLTNAVRDLQTALVIAGGEKGAVTAAKMLKDYPKASKGIWSAVRNNDNTGWAKVYNEMVEAGGRTGWFDLKDVGETTKEVSRRIELYNSSKTSDSLMRAIDSTGKLISDANEVFEMSIRTSAYKQMVDAGMSKTAAANYAKNMTVNFNKRGNWGMLLNSAYLFANAGIQGSARLLMAMKHKNVRRATYGIMASSYALNELNERLNPEGFARLQDFEKERNLIIMLPKDGNKYNLPGIEGDPRNGYYLKMPLPYGFNIFKVAGDVAYDVVNGKKTNAEAMVQMLKSIDASFNPLSSGTPIQFISPTFADPFVSHWENKNWFGAPIMPEQPAFAPAVRDSDRYFSGARDISVTTAQFLNRITGGNEVTAGAVDISPETIDHVIDSLGGGLGNFLGQVIDGTLNVATGEIPVPEEMPFVRKMIDRPFETGEQSQVFELLDRSATNRMSKIETKRFADSVIQAVDLGQIDNETAKRVMKTYISNAARQEAGEFLSLLNEGKQDEAMAIIENAPPGVAKELKKLIKDDLEREIKKLQKEKEQ